MRLRNKKGKPKYKTVPKPGVRPLSVMHPDHPARRSGWLTQETANRDRQKFQ